jgi:hypothetical protein
MNPDELDSVEETLDILSDPKAMLEIDRSETAIAVGEVVDAAALRDRYLNR